MSKSKAKAIAKRRDIVAANYLAGLNYQDMADQLGVSIGTIASDIKSLLDEWREARQGLIEDAVLLEERRLDVILNAIWKDAKDGNNAAIDRFLKLSESRRRLRGMDAPGRMQVDMRKDSDEETRSLPELRGVLEGALETFEELLTAAKPTDTTKPPKEKK